MRACTHHFSTPSPSRAPQKSMIRSPLVVSVVLVVGLISQTLPPVASQSSIPVPCGGALPHATNYTVLYECLRHLPFSESMRQSTLNTLESFIASSYVFNEISKSYVDPKQHFSSLSIDLVAQLEQMRTKTYAYDYDFHADVTKLFNSLEDAHTRYHAPAPYAGVSFLQPVRFEHVVNPFSARQSMYHSPLPTTHHR